MNRIKKLPYAVVTVISTILILTQCEKNFEHDSYAPSPLETAKVKSITANNGGNLYCSISGGCPLEITGINFFRKAKVFIGPYPCLNVIIADDFKKINCTVGPGKTGVFDIKVINFDDQPSEFDSSITDPQQYQFSYASFLYVGVLDSPGKVYGYAQNPSTGALLSINGSPFSIAGNDATYGTVISPNNKFLYTANVSSGTISIFSINSKTGQLSAVGNPINSGGSQPNGLAFHPSGQFLFVTNQGSNSVSAFTVNENGTLFPVLGSPFSSGSATTLNSAVVDLNGKYLYVASMGGSGGLVGYSISEKGDLTLLPGSPFFNNNGGYANTADGLALHPNKKWLYAGLIKTGRVTAFSIDEQTGELSGIGTPTLNNTSAPYNDTNGSGANVSNDGLHFYGTAFSNNAAHAKKIILYNIDQLTGELSRASDFDAGGGPNDIRVDTNGLFAYSCNSSNSPSISSFSRNPQTGELTPLTPRDISIPTNNGGPGIMVIQK